MFPREILDKCFEPLMPKLCGMEDAVLSFGNCADLLRCRLVVQTIYNLASRWVWRRLELKLSGPLEPAKLSQLLDIAAFLVAHPEVAEYVRIFSIIAGTYLEHDLPTAAISALLGMAPLLQNLRLLNVNHASMTILGGLLSQPLLHTVLLRGIDCSGLPDVLESKANSSIKRLVVCHCMQPEKLYPLMPSVEAFSSRNDGDEIAHMPPWDRLREVAFENHERRCGPCH
jgi:hypothetical protein